MEHDQRTVAISSRQAASARVTDLDSQGVSGLFPAAEVKELVQVLREVSAPAAA